MAWIEVPTKLRQYAVSEYAPVNADLTLLAEYGARDLNGVPEARREDFESDLDYRLGACVNLANSKAMRPSK